MSESLFVWDQNKYGLKVSSMDAEHQKLIEYMNVLFAKHEAKAPRSELKKALGDLGEYTVKHFKDEEAFFTSLPNYDKKDSHIKIHKDLLEKFGNHAANFEKTGTLTPEFFTFLKVWLTAHIAGIDMKYAEAAHKKVA